MYARTVLWYVVFFGFAVNYMMRINMNIAIVSMVKPRPRVASLSTKFDGKCYNYTEISSEKNITSSTKNLDNLFEWDEIQQTEILGGFFWLHWLTTLPGGLLAHQYGTKHVFGLSNFFPVLICFLIPAASYFDYKMVIILRVLQGLFAGFSWPSMHCMVAKWVPPHDRSKFVSAYLGSSVGVGVTYFLCGFIIDYFGWEYVFYVTGSIGIIWYILWSILVYETPDDHPWISDEERLYISNSIGKTFDKKEMSVPWKAIMLSRSVWIAILGQWGTVWIIFTLLTHTPTYLKIIHGLDIKTTGLISGLPHIFRLLFALLVGACSDHLIRKKIISTTNTRKIATAICTIVQGVMLVWLAFSGCNTMMAIIAMISSVTLQGATTSGPITSLLDISPNFSGILLGISGMISVTPGFISPAIVGFLTENEQTESQWQKVFMISAIISFITGIIYVCFGSAELEDWNSGTTKQIKEIQPLHEENVYSINTQNCESTVDKNNT